MVATEDEVRLTSLSHGAGCACKLGPQELASLVGVLPPPSDPELLVGFDTADDAAVYRVSEDLAIVLTADFFTPIVDDPFEFGRIAATNALSDIYAMGARPLVAINLVAYSIRAFGPALLHDILRGGATAARHAGVALAGGHSIDDPEPKYGLAVVGTVDPDRVLTNNGGQPGDELYLTKPIGGGLVTTAAKKDLASEELISRAVRVMCELNAEASRAAIAASASAATDVTGFGLLGHLHELAQASGVAAKLDAAAVPRIEGVTELADDPRCIAGGTRRNREHAETFTRWASEVDTADRVLLADAMTSGGLLVAVPQASGASALGVRIGCLTPGPAGELAVG